MKFKDEMAERQDIKHLSTYASCYVPSLIKKYFEAKGWVTEITEFLR